jgi:polysaccharide export outer membrane protein
VFLKRTLLEVGEYDTQAGVVYVVGDVNEPTGIIMDNPPFRCLTGESRWLMGRTHGSDGLGQAIRQVNGVPHEIPIALKKIASAKSTDIALQTDDICLRTK